MVVLTQRSGEGLLRHAFGLARDANAFSDLAGEVVHAGRVVVVGPFNSRSRIILQNWICKVKCTAGALFAKISVLGGILVKKSVLTVVLG